MILYYHVVLRIVLNADLQTSRSLLLMLQVFDHGLKNCCTYQLRDLSSAVHQNNTPDHPGHVHICLMWKVYVTGSIDAAICKAEKCHVSTSMQSVFSALWPRHQVTVVQTPATSPMSIPTWRCWGSFGGPESSLRIPGHLGLNLGGRNLFVSSLAPDPEPDVVLHILYTCIVS